VIAGYLLIAEEFDADVVIGEFNAWLDNTDLQDISAALEASIDLMAMPTIPVGGTPDHWYSDALFAAWLLIARPDLITRDPSLGSRLSGQKTVNAVTGQVNDIDFAIKKVGDHADISMFTWPKDATGKPKAFYPDSRAKKYGTS
jgi:hypothetical protein